MDFILKTIDFFKKVNKKYVVLISVALALCGVLIWYGLKSDEVANPDYNVINRAQVAKGVAMLFHNLEEINDNEMDEFQGQEKAWYHKYMNMMYQDSYYSTKDIKPMERDAVAAFTYGDLDKLYTNMGVVDRQLLSYEKNNRKA